jgi:hypothetical protein
MTDHAIELDQHRGMAAQKATELRRLVSEVAADRAKLKARQDELEKFLLAAPAVNWTDAAAKARYLLSLFAATSEAQDPRRQTLIANLLDDFERLLAPRTNEHADGSAANARNVTMAKGQKRSSRQPRKPKTADKKLSGPKYLRPEKASPVGRVGAQRPGQRSAPKQ